MQKNVLIVSASYIARGGVESFLLNWISQAPSGVSFTWYYPCRSIDVSCEEKFREKGVKLVCGNSNHFARGFAEVKKYINLYKNIKTILREGTFDIVHVNTGSFIVEAIALRLAKKNGIPIRIAHSHSAGAFRENQFYKKLFHGILKPLITKYATIKVACSYEAAVSLFGARGARDAVIVNNAIQTEKYAFSPEMRAIKRCEIGIKEGFVLGHVGRLSPEKNQKFLIDIFNYIHKKKEGSKLVIVGEGALASELKEYAVQLGLKDAVIFVGAVDDTSLFYSAMDVFVLPSFYEGLPIVGIEAQASGLPCFFSDCVSKYVKLIDDCYFLSLGKSAEQWADDILKIKEYEIGKRYEAHYIVENMGFGLSHLKKMMRILYGKDIYSTAEEDSK